MVKTIYIQLVCLGLLLTSCFREVPDYTDGNLDMYIYVKMVSEEYNINELIDSAVVTISTTDYEIPSMSDTTDSNGLVHFSGLKWANYNGLAEREKFLISTDFGSELIPLIKGKTLVPTSEVYIDTIYMNPPQPRGLKINELYTCGPQNNFFYFYDQYFEIYNSAYDTLYLDGIHFCRMGHMSTSITYIFQFPGEPLVGREYPVAPGTFVVCAMDALNHKQIVFNGRASVDLSVADWEFRNPMDVGDYDNPDVPNIENIEVGFYLDFMVGVTGDVILIADGSDDNYFDGIDINTVIDCVEYSSISTHIKDIEEELDYGFAGVGLNKYSGQSIERKHPGFDTNNSTVDFEIIKKPTVGYHH